MGLRNKMGLPLYPAAKQHLPSEQSIGDVGNAGLWFERFFHGYNKDWKVCDAAKKRDWLKRFNRAVGDEKALSKRVIKQRKLVKALNGQSIVFKTDWHFVTGTGYPHPVENGLNWHPVWGTPYLAGAAVKGLVRSWVEQ